MENYDHIIEGMLYIRGDEGLDIKEISVVLEVSKKKATELIASVVKILTSVICASLAAIFATKNSTSKLRCHHRLYYVFGEPKLSAMPRSKCSCQRIAYRSHANYITTERSVL